MDQVASQIHPWPYEFGPTSCRAIPRATVGPGSRFGWWGYVDLNHGPLPYQGNMAIERAAVLFALAARRYLRTFAGVPRCSLALSLSWSLGLAGGPPGCAREGPASPTPGRRRRAF